MMGMVTVVMTVLVYCSVGMCQPWAKLWYAFCCSVLLPSSMVGATVIPG